MVAYLDITGVQMNVITTQCCIAGGGPAGMMLGYLMARAGVETVVLEKHADFLRDFRGDTVHPSTLRIMDELGLLDEFLQLPHQKLQYLRGYFGNERVQLGDFTGLPPRYNFIAFMPQWDFLNFLAAHGKRFPQFKVLMESNVKGLIEEGGIVGGVNAEGPVGAFEVRAPLTIGADGRHSTVRDAAGLHVEDVGVPIDVLWFRVGRDRSASDGIFTRITAGKILITLDRGEYWQCAYVIPKGGSDALHARGLDAFKAGVLESAPQLRDHIADIRNWDDVKLLVVTVDRLTNWSRPGVLCIGDAAHAMSPVGGVGINLAVQDAVATANALAAKLRSGAVTADDLDSVRRRRLFPTRATQMLQIQMQNNVLAPVITGKNAELKVPLAMRMLTALPPLQRFLARMVGLGVRPEHVESPQA